MPSCLSFSRRNSPPPPDSCRLKRPRPLTDVDGEGSVDQQKKKRRLRLVLITSRLSCPFSSPSTHIICHSSSKIAVWAKQKALGRNLLRKAAIMNRIRKHALAIHNNESHQLYAARQMVIFFSRSKAPSTSGAASPFTDHNSFTRRPWECRTPSRTPSNARNEHLPPPAHIPCKPLSRPCDPRRQYIPLPRPPLYLTNYDIFDDEDGYFDSDSDTESESNDGENSRVYSDFSILEPSEPVLDDHDAIASFDSLTFGSRFLLMETLKGDEKSSGMRLEKERQKEVSFVHFGF